MTEVYATVETYDFRCGRCGHAWEQDYEVRRWQDPEGDEFTCYRVNGVLADVPTDTPCPDCGGYRVQLLPLHGSGSADGGAVSDNARTRTNQFSSDRTAGPGERRTPWYGWIVMSEISHLPE